MILPEGKGWARYQRVSELLLVPKTDDVENVKNEYKTDEGIEKEVLNILYMMLTQYKDSKKLLVTNRVSCNDEFLIKCLI